MFRVYLSLGSNVGNRLEYLKRAVNEIGKNNIIHQISSLYETEPVGMPGSEYFYNIVIEIETFLFPSELLTSLKKIESRVGVRRRQFMQSREIDIDIILYEGYTYEDSNLCLPHPRFHFRRFVLEPLYEIAPILVDPKTNLTIGAILRKCRDQSKVTCIGEFLNKTDFQTRSNIEILT